MQNDNKNFLDEIINDVSELEFKKIHNLIFCIVGLLSPTVPNFLIQTRYCKRV